jgi:NosR/NirI family nitrous oxide reductase transcriptional regulator
VLSLGLGVATVVYLGFWLNNSFTYVTYTQPFLGTSWSYILAVYAALVMASAIWGGNTYCRYICPYGNVQRLLVRIMPWHGRLVVSNRVLGLVRWAITAALVIGIALGLRDWGSYELFPDLFGLEFLESKWFWLSVAVVLISAYYPMLWCRMLCPTGAILDGVSDLARSRRKTKVAVSLADIPVKVEPATAR